MNPKLEQFLNLKKQEELNKRNNHLRLLGLTDNTKQAEAIYSKKEFPGSSFNSDSHKYYTTKAAIEVTDEEYAEICKYSPSTEDVSSLEKNVATIKKIIVFFTWLWAICVALWIIILLASL